MATGNMDREQSPATFSVLEAHQHRNGKSRAPDPRLLHGTTGLVENSGDDHRHTSRQAGANSGQSNHRITHQSQNRNRDAQYPDELGDATYENSGHNVAGDIQEDGDDYDDDDDQPAANIRAPRNSKTDKIRGPKRTQLEYYSGPWVDILKAAKEEYCLFLHTSENPFPECGSQTLQDTHNCLLEVLECHEDDPGAEPLDKSKCDLMLW